MLHLVALPLWLLGVLLVGGMTLAALLGPPLVRRHVSLERLSAHNEVAGFKFATLGVVYAVQLAFAVIIVWEKYHEAENTVAQEAGAIASMYRLSGGLEPKAQEELRAELARYLHAAVADDWPAMARGGSSRDVTRILTDVYGTALAYEPNGSRGAPLLSEILGQLDKLTQARRQRLGLASGTVPGVVWLVLFTGAALTIGFTFFFGTENLRAQALMSAMLGLVISMSLFVVVLIDHPFAGSVRVTPEALEAVLEAFGGSASVPAAR
jgi:hypothetical protein